MSCATTLVLGLIQPNNNFDNSIPSSASLISSIADQPKEIMLVSKPKKIVCSSKEQSHLTSKSEEYHVNQCVVQKDKEETSMQECQANVIYMDDKNCQSTLCSDKIPTLLICSQYSPQ